MSRIESETDALRIFGHARISLFETVKDLLAVYEARYGESGKKLWSTTHLLAFMYDAGRVQGIRSERAKRAGKIVRSETVKSLRLTAAGCEETYKTLVEGPCVTLAACRVNAGMNPETWAAALGVTVETVKRWEAGKATPKTSTVFRIAQLSRIPLGIIQTGDQEARA